MTQHNDMVSHQTYTDDLTPKTHSIGKTMDNKLTDQIEIKYYLALTPNFIEWFASNFKGNKP